MPIYEYNCEGCGKNFEALLKTAKDKPSKCPLCGSKKISKAFSAFAVSAKAGRSRPSAAACKPCGSAGTGCGCGCKH